jgi:hypothetical protein
MGTRADIERLLAILNGNWTIECVVLAFISVAYLVSLGRQLRFSWRNWLFDMLPGMRVAVAILVMSIGSALVRGTVWVWAFVYHRADYTPQMLLVLIFGATLGAGGFLMAIVEIGIPLFGNWPVVITIGCMVIFTVATLLFGG